MADSKVQLTFDENHQIRILPVTEFKRTEQLAEESLAFITSANPVAAFRYFVLFFSHPFCRDQHS